MSLLEAAILVPDPLLAMADPASPSPSSVVNLTAHCRTNHKPDLSVVEAVSVTAAATATALAPDHQVPVPIPVSTPASSAPAPFQAPAPAPAFPRTPEPALPGTVGTPAGTWSTPVPVTGPGSAAILSRLRAAPATFFFTMGNGKGELDFSYRRT